MCSCDDGEVPEMFSVATPVARKEHRCCECPFPIVKGEKYVVCSGKWDGEFSSHKQHEECNQAANISPNCGSVFGGVRHDIMDCELPKHHQSRKAWAKLLWRFRKHPKAKNAKTHYLSRKLSKYPDGKPAQVN